MLDEIIPGQASLECLFLSPSVEVIDPTVCEISAHIHQYCVVDNRHFFVENDCLLGTNAHELIQYQSASQMFYVGSDISLLSGASFMSNSTIETIIFEAESRLRNLPAFGFFCCTELRRVEIPKCVRVIGENCFAGCCVLTEVIFESPPVIHTIESEAFTRCSLLASFIVPSSVSTLGNSVFYKCLELSTVLFDTPSHLTHIPDFLFRRCARLTSLVLPDSVITISGSAFADSGIASVSGSNYFMYDSLLLNMVTIVYCFGKPRSIKIPSGVRQIGERAFANVDSLMHLTFEDGVVCIGPRAFDSCTAVQAIVFPASLKVISENAFVGCRSLHEVAFAAGSQLQSIGKGAFSDSPLNAIVLPAGFSEIDPSAFSRDVWPIVTFDG
jgi:hypothetical protein